MTRLARLGIVGSEAAKFTVDTEALARAAIRELIRKYKPATVVSGACPLGGIDIWAIEEAKKNGFALAGHTVLGLEFPPEVQQWDPPGKIGFKTRNLSIAKYSDIVVCITVKELPPGYSGMKFDRCYHHKRKSDGADVPHVKSGGCWTVAQAALKGKHTELVVISAQAALNESARQLYPKIYTTPVQSSGGPRGAPVICCGTCAGGRCPHPEGV